MRRVFGDVKKINLGSSEFRSFIENGSLYIDKTRFIEHVLTEPSDVLLFTRPRRTGKSLNLDMLRTFFDCNQDTKELFRDLYIGTSPAFDQVNSRPVIYVNFRELGRNCYEEVFREILKENAGRYLRQDQTSEFLHRYLTGDNAVYKRALYSLTKDVHEAHGIKPYILIDEYDKLLMDNISNADYETIRDWLRNVFESSLKDNHHLGKAVMVGVTRISQESLLSGLNNLEVFDVFEASVFDGDFSLTEQEVSELLGDEQLETATQWYNNYRVGDLKLFTMYSVLSYAKKGIAGNYWGMSGSMDMLIDALDAKRTDEISELLANGKEIQTTIERRMPLRRLQSGDVDDSSYYSFAVQTGYLTYELHQRNDIDCVYRLRFPNLELKRVWHEFILNNVLKSRLYSLRDIFRNIADTEGFSQDLQDFISFQLSSYDIGKEVEKTYHVLVFGLILGAGFKCSSNRERGFGRYALWLEGPDFNVIIEFKKAKKETDDLEKLASAAIAQIDKRKYYASFSKNVPLYKVGVGCFKAECFVAAEAHDFGR